jgi:hypothetical protein
LANPVKKRQRPSPTNAFDRSASCCTSFPAREKSMKHDCTFPLDCAVGLDNTVLLEVLKMAAGQTHKR